MRGLVVLLVALNEWNRRQYMILADILEERGLEFDLVFPLKENLDVPYAQRFLASKLLRQKARLPGGFYTITDCTARTRQMGMYARRFGLHSPLIAFASAR